VEEKSVEYQLSPDA